MPDHPITASDATILLRQGFFGVDPDCFRDDTTRVVLGFSSTAFGDKVRVIPDLNDADNYRWAEAELAGDADDIEGVSRGWLRIYRREAGSDELIDEIEVAGLLPDVPLSLCVQCDASSVLATLLGETLEVFTPEINAPGGTLTACGTGTITGAVTFHSFSVNHKIYETACADCLDHTGAECSICSGGGLGPQRIKARIEDVVNGVDPWPYGDFAAAFNRTWLSTDGQCTTPGNYWPTCDTGTVEESDKPMLVWPNTGMQPYFLATYGIEIVSEPLTVWIVKRPASNEWHIQAQLGSNSDSLVCWSTLWKQPPEVPAGTLPDCFDLEGVVLDFHGIYGSPGDYADWSNSRIVLGLP